LISFENWFGCKPDRLQRRIAAQETGHSVVGRGECLETDLSAAALLIQSLPFLTAVALA